jgi:hypothetical protein
MIKTMTKTKLMSLLVISAVVMLIGDFVKDVLTVHDARSFPRNGDALPASAEVLQARSVSVGCVPVICSVHYDQLASAFLWAHRGRLHAPNLGSTEEDGCIDASAGVMGALLNEGISNFDVDIVNSDSNSNFWVAHPTAWDQCRHNNSFQTLPSFLHGIRSHFAAARPHIQASTFPTVSMEPKFRNRTLLLRLIETVSESIYTPICQLDPGPGVTNTHLFLRVAIVVHNVEALRFVTGHLKRIQSETDLRHKSVYGISSKSPLLTVALAYRSQLLSPSDYVWTELSAQRVQRQQIELLEVATGYNKRTPSTSSPTFLYIKKFHMPDVALLLAYPAPISSLSTNQSVNSENRVKGLRLQPEVVTWVVDEPSELCAALAGGADAVISNEPVLLLKYLQLMHRKECHSL